MCRAAEAARAKDGVKDKSLVRFIVFFNLAFCVGLAPVLMANGQLEARGAVRSAAAAPRPTENVRATPALRSERWLEWILAKMERGPSLGHVTGVHLGAARLDREVRT